MDISGTLAPKSDQLDAVDLLGGAQTFTIERVSKGSVEQPVNIHLAGFPRPWRPGKSMRRVLVACWGPDASKYVDRGVRLWCDPSVTYGGAEVGGVRVLALSHLDKPKKVPLLVTRGRSAVYVVDPLPKTPSHTPSEGPRPAGGEPAGEAGQPPAGSSLASLFAELGLTEMADRLAYCADVLQRPVQSPSDLTSDDQSRVIEALAADLDAGDRS